MRKIPASIKIFIGAAILLSIFVCQSNFSGADPYQDLLTKAIASFRSGNVDDALGKISELGSLGQEKDTEMADFIAGECWLKKGGKELALEYFEKASSAEGFVLGDWARLARAEALDDLGRRAEAKDLYERLIIDYPTSALSRKSILFLARVNAAEGNHKGAVELFDLVIYSPEEDDLVSEAKFLKARSLEAMKNYRDAADTYFSLNFYSPGSPFSKQARANLNSIVKRTKMRYPTATKEELYSRAMDFYDRADFASASSELYRLLKAYPGGPFANKTRLMLGMSEYKRRKFKTAFYHLEKIAAWNADGADQAQFYLSFIYAGWGRFNSTIASLRKVVARYPGSRFADEAAYYIGYFYDTNGFKSRGMAEFKDFLSRYPKSDFADDALWRMGKFYWANKDYEAAFETFSRADAEFPRDATAPNCILWAGLSALKLDRKDEAKNLFFKLIKEFDHTYASYRARERLKALGVGQDEINYTEAGEGGSPKDLEYAFRSDPDGSMNDHLKKYEALASLGLFNEAKTEASYLVQNAPDEEKDKAQILYYYAKHQMGDFREALRFAEARYLPAVSDGTLSEFDYKVWQLAFPRGFWSHVIRYSVEYDLDPYFVLAIIREESRFNSTTLSWARAHGLMQIIPSTGRGVARLIGLRPYYTYRLFEPETNIRMGCYYLSSLMKRFNGNPYYAAAAYNGGPLRVKAWLGKWEREIGGDVDLDEFVERIPFSETRRYVQKVMYSYNEYKRIYDRSGPVRRDSEGG